VKIRYFYPYWGSENLPIKEVLTTISENGFDGIEINFPDDLEVLQAILNAKEDGLQVIAQQVLENKVESPREYLHRAISRLEEIKVTQPDQINSHTGKDHFSFKDNCFIISELEDWSAKNNIPIQHEIHRGRFSFHSSTILPYLDKFPYLKLVGDFSHWCTVSESLLEDQEENVEKTIRFVAHIHARIGWSQAAQVNDPFAKEWKETFERFIGWWQQIIDFNKENGSNISITPEFGPYPYMPETPHERKPLADQKEVNLKLKSHLLEKLRV